MKELKIRSKKAKLKIGKTVIPIVVKYISFKRGELYKLDTLLHPYDVFDIICDDENKDLITQHNYGIPCVLSNGEK